jgi:hypothetical protein
MTSPARLEVVFIVLPTNFDVSPTPRDDQEYILNDQSPVAIVLIVQATPESIGANIPPSSSVLGVVTVEMSVTF